MILNDYRLLLNMSCKQNYLCTPHIPTVGSADQFSTTDQATSCY